MSAVAYALGHAAVLGAFAGVGAVLDWVRRAGIAAGHDRGWWA